MKRLVHILVLAMVLTSCTPSVETRVIPSESGNIASPNQQLQAIDTLMWQQPDSALAVLVDFAASLQADSLDAFDGHYCQMLVSELLYKNDCEQSNRTELLRAVDYFDSVCGMQTAGRDASWHVSTHNDDIVFINTFLQYQWRPIVAAISLWEIFFSNITEIVYLCSLVKCAIFFFRKEAKIVVFPIRARERLLSPARKKSSYHCHSLMLHLTLEFRNIKLTQNEKPVFITCLRPPFRDQDFWARTARSGTYRG